GDELEGKVTKVVSFGAFVEILDGVEGLVHISELAQHHVESPREVVSQGDELKVKILEIESERRRLSLSVKRVEGQDLPIRELGPEELGEVRDLDLSDEVFPEGGGEPVAEAAAEEAPAEAEAEAADEPVAEGAVEEASAEAKPGAEPEAVVEEAPAEAEAEAEPEAAAPAEDEPTQE
nr:S1 RNA-binding domain-containing protein [Thermoleophilaceae bacterium]